MMDEEGFLDWLVNSTAVGPGISSARIPGSMGPWELFSASGRILFVELTVAITTTELFGVGQVEIMLSLELLELDYQISVY